MRTIWRITVRTKVLTFAFWVRQIPLQEESDVPRMEMSSSSPFRHLLPNLVVPFFNVLSCLGFQVCPVLSYKSECLDSLLLCVLYFLSPSLSLFLYTVPEIVPWIVLCLKFVFSESLELSPRRRYLAYLILRVFSSLEPSVPVRALCRHLLSYTSLPQTLYPPRPYHRPFLGTHPPSTSSTCLSPPPEPGSLHHTDPSDDVLLGHAVEFWRCSFRISVLMVIRKPPLIIKMFYFQDVLRLFQNILQIFKLPSKMSNQLSDVLIPRCLNC